MNIIDYVKINKKTLEENPIKDTDFAIFAQLAYLNFSKFQKRQEYIRIGDFSLEDDFKYLAKTALAEKESLSLIKEMSKSKRFKDVEVFGFETKKDSKVKMNFGAMTFKFGDNYIISFRGTDTTLDGWYESMQLSYDSNIPGQELALDYLYRILDKIPDNSKIFLTGHSKGGNICQYAFLNTSKENQDRISCIYNFEGPGNRNKYFENEEFVSLQDKIHKYVTSDSIIGMLLYDFQKHTVIDAKGTTGIVQHTIFTWKIDTTSLNLLKTNSLSKNALAFSIAIDKWLSKYNKEDTKYFVDLVFKLLDKAGIKDQKDFEVNTIDTLSKLVNEYSKTQKDERKSTINRLNTLFKLFMKYRFMSKEKLIELSKYERFLFEDSTSKKSVTN